MFATLKNQNTINLYKLNYNLLYFYLTLDNGLINFIKLYYFFEVLSYNQSFL